ncbi:MAG: hypothetical protein L0312_32590 [Acidobacteria bacterium]|nr:hypothetical protein [Acidobacteriota bacterium]
MMTIAVSEILKQAELLSAEEQLELAAKLTEQAQRHVEAQPRNGEAPGAEAPSQPSAEGRASEYDDEEEEEWLDVFRLNHAPPLDSYVIKVKFVDGGIGQPRRYDFGDLFEEEESVG